VISSLTGAAVRRRVSFQRLLTLFAATLAIPPLLHGEPIELRTDRDAFTPAAHTVEPGTLLSECSYVYIDNRTGYPTNNIPELLLRYGTSEWWEWRFGVNYGIGSQGNVVTSVEAGEGPPDGSTLYESSLLYGFKADISNQEGWLPESCFIMEGSTPTFGTHDGTVPVATAVAGWALPWWPEREDVMPWRLDMALRYAYSEGHFGWFNRWSPSVVLRMPLTERLEIHTEWFGSFTSGLEDEQHQPFFSPGGHFVLTERLEIGLRVGWGLTEEAAPFFADVGIAMLY